jgi:mevalonate kinase
VLNLNATMLNLLVSVLNRHAVWYGNNAVQCVVSTRMQVMVFQTSAGMCLQLMFMYIYLNKVNKHEVNQNYTHECSNHTAECENHKFDCSNHKQSAKITLKVPKSHAGCQHHTHNVKITLVHLAYPLART